LLVEEFSEYNDVYFCYEYFKLYSKHYNAEPEGIFWENENIKIFWPHLIRDISMIEKFNKIKYYDLTTPYGYGGPLIIARTEDKDEINKALKNFFIEYNDYALKNNYICEFIRFHPIFGNQNFLNDHLNIEYINDVVIIDLNKDLELIWQNMKEGHKYNIRKSVREGCEAGFTNSPLNNNLITFIQIYDRTMDKNKASKKYYFKIEFIEDHFKLLNSLLIEVRYHDSVIGTSIFIYGNNIVHYHLSGASQDFKGVYPTDLILWEAIKWAKKNKFMVFHLGGGINKNDGLFNFKKGFSDEQRPFYTGKIIFNKIMYDKLCEMNNNKPFNNYFPKYRTGLDEKII
jgi:serine/alanine adding enzyme